MGRDINSERVQIMLNALGYNTHGIDGIIGRNTQAALRAFQDDYGMDDHGQADQETVDALFNAFNENDIHASGIVIQALVRNAGYNPGTLDGVVGRNTRAAVADFQRDQGMDVTGEADYDTIEALKSLLYGAC